MEAHIDPNAIFVLSLFTSLKPVNLLGLIVTGARQSIATISAPQKKLKVPLTYATPEPKPRSN